MGVGAFIGIVDPETSVADQHTGARTILLVEDDPLVAEACAMLLEDFGYIVKRAETADRALEVLAAGEKIDLVFSDIVMPGTLSGVELAQILREQAPTMPVLLTSGFSRIAAEAVKKGFELLPKPYLPSDLQRTLQQALEGDQPKPGLSL